MAALRRWEQHAQGAGGAEGCAQTLDDAHRSGYIVGEWHNIRRDLEAACKRAKIDRISPTICGEPSLPE